MKVAVVGAGIMGLCSGFALVRRGHDVTVFEQFEPGHQLGSSHGNSRIVRKAYPDQFYTEIMAEAYPLGASLQALIGRTILHEPGLLYFGSDSSPGLKGVIAGLESVGEPFQIVDSANSVRLREDEIGVFTPAAGWVHAARVMSGLRSKCGAIFVQKLVLSTEELVGYDRFVICTGPWIEELVPHVDVSVCDQVFGYFPVPTPVEGPVWIDESPQFFYGFPSEPSAVSVKIGFHTSGHSIEEQKLALAEEAYRRFGISESGTFHTCRYTNTPDEDFRWGHLGERGYWLSACSGHGFKFAPWLGERMADLVEGRISPDSQPRFFRG